MWLSRVLGFCLAAAFVVIGTLPAAAQTLPVIVANDNRSPAGELRNGVLTLHLEIGKGQWRPESDNGETIPIYALGEAGRPLQIPGPLIRVEQGTEIHASVHNALPVAAAVHGLHERPGEDRNPIALQPGATQEVRFQAGAPGTYYYWATTTGNPVATRSTLDTQLAGALVVDPPGAARNDRIFMIGLWYAPKYRAIPKPQNYREISTINGKSWPHTERLGVRLGEPVHWRWINTSVSGHGMHLHGFYFQIDSTGDGQKVQRFNDAARPRIVTHHVRRGQTFDMTWTPDRSGRWLFHCHMIGHMAPPEPASATSESAGHSGHGSQMASSGMGGLVLGITVVPDKEQAKPSSWHAERKMQLVIEERKSPGPLFALAVRDLAQGSRPSQPSAAPLIGPPIVLTSGQPTEIEVVNRLKEPTAIHWHGIELESYYDGVPDWAGTAQQSATAVPAGKSFVARMAPPHAGTFIYHTHFHDERQLTNGIYGPLIVLPPGQRFDPTYDRAFVVGVGNYEPFGEMLLVNGNPQPPVLPLKVGKKYRFRLINITPDGTGMQMKVTRSGVPVQWRAMAKDGADLPAPQAILQKADLVTTVGETYDFEYEATQPEELTFEAYIPDAKMRTTQTVVFQAE